jgi:RNA polymerase sigma-70 factor (ECF subfamily)
VGNGRQAPPGSESAREPEQSDRFDAAAEEDLVHSFRERIFVMALVRTRDRSAAQDLAQEALLAAIVALRAGRLRDPEKLSAFVWGTARNVINNFVRARRRVPAGEALVDVVGAEGSQLQDLESGERLSLVTRALARLEPSERAILQMTLVEGLQPDEITLRLGLTSDVMRQRKCRALRKITKVVENLSRR